MPSGKQISQGFARGLALTVLFVMVVGRFTAISLGAGDDGFPTTRDAESLAHQPETTSGGALADDEASPADPDVVTETADTPPAPLRRPRYAPLRFNDDFSYLEGPEGSYEPDFFDPIKWIRLDDDFVLSLGGEIRGRMEAITFKRYGAGDKRQDTFFIHRYMPHADLRYRELARIFIQGVSGWAHGIDGTPVPNPEDRLDVQQLFGDIRFLGEDIPLTFRIGRQELQYGNQRLVSALDWANIRRSWDGLKLLWQTDELDVDVWWARPVRKLPTRRDRIDRDVDFYGAYATYKGIENHGIDGYFLALRDTGGFTNANMRTGDLSLYTMGGRFWGRTPVGEHWWDYETELAGQWGKAAGDTLGAWMWSFYSGYTLSDVPWSPRLGFGFDYASGDRDPRDRRHGTFNQLFPLGHAHFGWIDQVGRQNVWAQNLNLTLRPFENVTTLLAWHTFWLDKKRDALYGVAGQPVRRDPTGRAGRRIGNELDFRVIWRLDVHATLLFGYSHFWAGNFIHKTGPGRDPNFFYVQYQYTF